MGDPYRITEFRGGKKVRVIGKDSQRIRQGKSPFTNSSSKKILWELFQTVFLPDGFPGSVSEDYVEYQIWDSLQALFSSISGSLATRAILEGIGVGDTSATALAATFTWLLRDGASMIGRIAFAAAKGRELDANCKQWRLFADVLNDASMALEVLAPIIFRTYATWVFCVAATGKAIVGVAGGATRAALTHHQAVQGNFADVAAKDGSQETLVNLAALFLSFSLLPIMTKTYVSTCLSFAILALLHIYSNYKAVGALKINRLNRHRINAIIEQYKAQGTVMSVKEVNEAESLFCLRRGKEKEMFNTAIEIASDVRSAAHLDHPITLFAEGRAYWMTTSRSSTGNTVYIFLDQKATAEDVIKAYYIAGMSGSTSITDGAEDCYKANTFIDALRDAGWSTTEHLLLAGEYRIEVKRSV